MKCKHCGKVIKQTNFDMIKLTATENGINCFIDVLCESGKCPVGKEVKKEFCLNGSTKCPLMIFNNWLFKEAK